MTILGIDSKFGLSNLRSNSKIPRDRLILINFRIRYLFIWTVFNQLLAFLAIYVKMKLTSVIFVTSFVDPD